MLDFCVMSYVSVSWLVVQFIFVVSCFFLQGELNENGEFIFFFCNFVQFFDDFKVFGKVFGVEFWNQLVEIICGEIIDRFDLVCEEIFVQW